MVSGGVGEKGNADLDAVAGASGSSLGGAGIGWPQPAQAHQACLPFLTPADLLCVDPTTLRTLVSYPHPLHSPLRAGDRLFGPLVQLSALLPWRGFTLNTNWVSKPSSPGTL